MQRIAKYGNMISRGVGNIWQSFQIGGYECIKREYVTSIKEALLLRDRALKRREEEEGIQLWGSAETSPVCFRLPVIDS